MISVIQLNDLYYLQEVPYQIVSIHILPRCNYLIMHGSSGCYLINKSATTLNK
jgi:hypothetical protein